MDRDLLPTQGCVEWAHCQCSSDAFGSLYEHFIKPLDLITPADSQELQQWLVVFKAESCLAACILGLAPFFDD